VRVRFAGQLVDGIILERVDATDHVGRLAPLAKVVSPEPVLSSEVAGLARAVADRYAGTLSDVLRLAVPPRHAGVEAEGASPPPPGSPSSPDPGEWRGYAGGETYLSALTAGGAPRAVWTALPGANWPALLATAVQAALAGGRGALVVVPDARDLDRLDVALTARLGSGRHVALRAELGPAERYRRWLAVRRGAVRAVVGTRAAMFAPVADLGLVAVWDDGDDLHAEPRAPYPHVREVACLRAHRTGAAALLGGTSVTAEGAQLIATGWARPLRADRVAVRAAAPRIVVAGDDAELARDEAAAAARLPSIALRTARDALERGPVLVQVPRRGYLPGLACQSCRHPARCMHCHGPLALTSAHAVAHCTWCGRPAGGWQCPECGASQFRAQVVGSRRTAEELGRAFPSVPVRTSGRDGVLATVPASPALVVATPGAEPIAHQGYPAALLLDGWALLSRPDLRAGEEALRRWLAAASLVRPGSAGGTVVVVADSGLPPVQALVRWDPGGHAERELAGRRQLGFPPAARVAVLTGEPAAVADLLARTELPAGAQVLGPLALPDGPAVDRASGRHRGRPRPEDCGPARPEHLGGRVPGDGPARAEARARAVVRVSRSDGAVLAHALQAAQGVRSARKAADVVRVQVDPPDLG
jgi:primosomal protein N' (replication factor Y)